MLKHAARERGIALADDVPAYLLTHFRRDMPSLMALLDALDRFSLEQKRAVTLPLLRTMLASPDADAIGEPRRLIRRIRVRLQPLQVKCAPMLTSHSLISITRSSRPTATTNGVASW